MTRTHRSLALAILGLAFLSVAGASSNNASAVCQLISRTLSSASEIFFPGSPQYAEDNAHYTISSTQNSTCTVEPGNVSDVAKIIKILADTRPPFGVKSGGHSTNPTFSSTSGVEVALTRLNGIDYDAASQTVAVGTGLVFDDVYAALAPHNVTVAGGRVTGIGVGGFTLGGGYSWKANQHGLTIDTVVAYELVLPSGHVVNVTSSSHPDLFFGLKGGGNNFGIVTKITFRVFPQGEVWGGLLTTLDIKSAVAATANFSEKSTDPKAAVLSSIGFANDTVIVSLQLFYDGPTPPPGLFDAFIALSGTALQSNLKTSSFLDFLMNDSPGSTDFRTRYNHIPVTDYSVELLNALTNESMVAANALQALHPNDTFIVIFTAEPFLPDILDHSGPSPLPNLPPTAYPPSRARRYLPTNTNIFWTQASSDASVNQVVFDAEANIRAKAAELGQPVGLTEPNVAKYPNYAAIGSSLESLYGTNLPTLKAIKEKYDPENVMGLAGGWKL
ncbi:FAD-binding domain-containing protein [Punctularia strigosozonata HHB-11173 SS5]|uniref:FAD-binding domain-containing protein n=1 Tax=Punctularia strigosozonata (strain HHB-11173) TaxID=741275 RepID=R7S252_PUNST|nr:FAD-binding domain-containing protein [Punctularia strigosozonata HHB-11173 SS5]EIN03944.1 FAD-binding domain-containing protein [Punctularia strigosozonata HHB-11173 SS5]